MENNTYKQEVQKLRFQEEIMHIINSCDNMILFAKTRNTTFYNALYYALCDISYQCYMLIKLKEDTEKLNFIRKQFSGISHTFNNIIYLKVDDKEIDNTEQSIVKEFERIIHSCDELLLFAKNKHTVFWSAVYYGICDLYSQCNNLMNRDTFPTLEELKNIDRQHSEIMLYIQNYEE